MILLFTQRRVTSSSGQDWANVEVLDKMRKFCGTNLQEKAVALTP